MILFIFIIVILKIEYKNILFLLFLVFCSRYIFGEIIVNLLDLNLDITKVYTTDEKILWYPALESLYSGNYFNTLTNNPYPGYGLLTTYISAINTYFLIGSNDFQYFLAINYLFIFLFITFLFEISKNKKYF